LKTALIALNEMALVLVTGPTAKGIIANSNTSVFINTELTQSMLGSARMPEFVSKAPTKGLGCLTEFARVALWGATAENTFLAGENDAIDRGFTHA
jgi:hypothetical protein